MDLDAVADELYGLRPEEFVTARDRRARDARAAGDQGLAKAVGALRRPSRAAWVSNLLVRRQPEEVRSLLGLGEELRRAHRELDGVRLRRLASRQNEVIGALGRQARRLAASRAAVGGLTRVGAGGRVGCGPRGGASFGSRVKFGMRRDGPWVDGQRSPSCPTRIPCGR
ncbi:hypothetical protein ACFVY4_03915 [Streptomyces sp. NPDC058299]|uniref:hypothetical protein n=1 Tax=Streptomyces sp. NPDC058299 TaxID=3346435 RepID=UPI0036EA04A6